MKCVVYIRVSSLDQHPENQRDECLGFASSKGYEVRSVFYEKVSAFKDKERPEYERVKELARLREVDAVVVWSLDRWVRNKDTLMTDVTLLRNYGVKLHSVREAWLEAINIDGPLGETVKDFLLGLIGSMAELESARKAERVRLAYEKHKADGKCSWGRRSIPERVKLEVLEARRHGKTMRQIASEVYYITKSKNKRFISVSLVHKILNEKEEG